MYQDCDLTLRRLARIVGVHFNALSFVLNDAYNKNFNNFINDFRLGHFLTLAKDKRQANRSLLELAFEVGFPSKTSFNRIFRAKYSMAPSKYISLEKK